MSGALGSSPARTSAVSIIVGSGTTAPMSLRSDGRLDVDEFLRRTTIVHEAVRDDDADPGRRVSGSGGPDEDRRAGFDRGGWTAAYADQEMGPVLESIFGRADGLLLGRKTLDIWEPYWPYHDDGDSFGHTINALPKYVPSTTRKDPTGRTRSSSPTTSRRPSASSRRSPGGAPGPRQRRPAPLAPRARPRRRAEPADLPRHRRRRASAVPGAWPDASPGARRLAVTTSTGVMVQTYRPKGRATFGPAG